MPVSMSTLGRTLWRALPALTALTVAAIVIVGSAGIVGPSGVYPLVLAVLLAAVGVFGLVRDLLNRTAPEPAVEADAGDAPPEEQSEEPGDPRAGVLRVLAVIASVVVFVAAVDGAGFWLSLVVPMVTTFLVMGVRSPWRIALATGLVIAVAYLLFVQLLDVSFPTGTWW